MNASATGNALMNRQHTGRASTVLQAIRYKAPIDMPMTRRRHAANGDKLITIFTQTQR